MSTSGTGSDGPTEKNPLSGLVKRMKTVLRRGDGSKRLSLSRITAATSKPAAGPSGSTQKTDGPTPAPAPVAVQENGTSGDASQPKKLSRADIHAERARRLNDRLHVTLQANGWFPSPPDKDVYRIEKPIRIRIHRECHRCSAPFEGTKSCPSCQHTRCTQCPRYPAKKPEGKGKEKLPATNGKPVVGLEVDKYWDLTEKLLLTRPNPKAGGQPLVRKKPVQRIRRTCCECSKTYTANSKTCAGCSHVRCEDCPRDPAKKVKYPDGYPGDAPSSKSHRPIKHACHSCGKVFPPVPHPESPEGQALSGLISKLECRRCGHELCQACPRALPRKVDPDPDPEIMKRVEAKLAELSIGASLAPLVAAK